MSLKNNGLIQSFRRRLVRSFKGEGAKSTSSDASVQVIKRKHHDVSRSDISKNALKVLYRLQSANYAGYLVGGSVRDLLLGRKPKDFDVATSATPEQVRKLFRNSRIIGRRFRLVHVFYKDEIIEVSTFRANAQGTPDHSKAAQVGEKPKAMIVADNVYGTIEEDAWRRDFTVNALYYTIEDFSVVDFTGGMEDIDKRQIRMLGDPLQRFHEDPVRLLRAIRLAAKLEFSIESNTLEQIHALPHLLAHVPQARLLDEIIKLFFEGNASITYKKLAELGYMKILFPGVAKVMQEDKSGKTVQLVEAALAGTDYRFHHKQRLTPGFLLAVFLWPVVLSLLDDKKKKGQRFFMALHAAMSDALKHQGEVCVLTKRMKTMMHSMWTLQYHLERRRPRRIAHLLRQRFFRAAYDLLCLRGGVGAVPKELVKWWSDIQVAKPKQRQQMIDQLHQRKDG